MLPHMLFKPLLHMPYNEGTSLCDSPVLNSDHFSIFQSFGCLTSSASHTRREVALHPWLRHFSCNNYTPRAEWRFHDFVTMVNGCVCMLTPTWVILLSPRYQGAIKVTHLWVPTQTSKETVPSCFFPLNFAHVNSKIWNNPSHDCI